MKKSLLLFLASTALVNSAIAQAPSPGTPNTAPVPYLNSANPSEMVSSINRTIAAVNGAILANGGGGGGGGGSGTVTQVNAGSGLSTAAGTCGSGNFTTTGTLSSCVAPSTQATGYTIGNGDNNKIIQYTGSSAGTYTQPAASATGNFAGNTWCTNILNTGTGTLTLAITGSTLNGQSSWPLGTGGFASYCSDGTNYEGQIIAGGVSSVASVGSGLQISGGVLSNTAQTTWPTSGNVVISNGTNTPAGIAPVNGQCLVGVSGAWAAASCSGTSSSNLGSSTSSTSPQIAGDATTGLYTAGAAKVDVAVSGAKVVEWGAGTENITGSDTITSTSSGCLSVGPNGATNPVLALDCSQTSAVTGISIQSKATGLGTVIFATDSGTNGNLTLSPKGAGTVAFNATSTDAWNLNGTIVYQAKFQNNGTTIAWSPVAYTTGVINHWLFSGAADTGLTASTEASIEYFNNANAARSHATGALALQRDFLINGATDNFVGASTLTDGATLGLVLKNCGTNGTCTNESGLLIPSAAVTGTVTNTYGINVSAATGGTNNYAANLNGPIKTGPRVSTGTTMTVAGTGCTAGTASGGSDVATFQVTSGGACSFAVTVGGALPAGATFWVCQGYDRTTTTDLFSPTTGTATTGTFTGNAATNDLIYVVCSGSQ